jgi:hypothetical protein
LLIEAVAALTHTPGAPPEISCELLLHLLTAILAVVLANQNDLYLKTEVLLLLLLVVTTTHNKHRVGFHRITTVVGNIFQSSAVANE